MPVLAPASSSTLPSGQPLAPPAASEVAWRLSPDAITLILSVIGALVMGHVMLYSASAYSARTAGHVAHWYVTKQAAGMAVGLLVATVLAKWDAQQLRRLAWPIMGVALFTMLLVVLPFTESIAPRINGSRRFLIGGSLQPSEFAKAAVVIWTAYLIDKKGDHLRKFFRGLMPFLVVIGTLCVLAALEPDLSVAMLYALQLAILLWIGGARLSHFGILGLIGGGALWVSVDNTGYIVGRLAAFVSGGHSGGGHALNYQLDQSLIAVGSGGWAGVGIGAGRQAAGYVPFPYSDFLASTIGEETGWLGLAAIAMLFLIYAIAGFRIAAQARTPFLTYVAAGLTLTTVLTALLHVGVVVGALPTTGLGLPFLSYGRSNLVLSLAMTGLLVNIGSHPIRRWRRPGHPPLG